MTYREMLEHMQRQIAYALEHADNPAFDDATGVGLVQLRDGSQKSVVSHEENLTFESFDL